MATFTNQSKNSVPMSNVGKSIIFDPSYLLKQDGFKLLTQDSNNILLSQSAGEPDWNNVAKS